MARFVNATIYFAFLLSMHDQDHFKAVLTRKVWSGYNPHGEKIIQQHNNLE
jgi:hypothetical protein